MSNVTLILRAASRLTPRMAFFQARRIVRDRLVPGCPDWYQARIWRHAAALPALKMNAASSSELLELISAFYRASADHLAGVSRGEFELLNTSATFNDIESIDWMHKVEGEGDHNLWRMKLSQLESVHSLLASGEKEGRATAIALLRAFRRNATFRGREVFKIWWSPYGASHRVLAILSGLFLGVRAGVTEGEFKEISEFIRIDVAFIMDNIEYELFNNHMERNLAAIALYLSFSTECAAKISKKLATDVEQIIHRTITSDGVQVERSAMYQGLTYMSLCIFGACAALPNSLRALAVERAKAVADAWRFLSHRDGDIALFNDAWLGEVPRPADLVGVPENGLQGRLREGGYGRISDGGVEVLFDCGPIGARWNPGHGHADFLSMEVDVDGVRLVVDPGTSTYCSGPQRTHERSAGAHNGPLYVGYEPVEFGGRFKVGMKRAPQWLPVADLGTASGILMGGLLEAPVGRVSRTMTISKDEGLVVLDIWNSDQRPGEVRLVIPKWWHVSQDDEHSLTMKNGPTSVSINIWTGGYAVKGGSWARRYGVLEEAHILVLSPFLVDGSQRLIFQIARGPVSSCPSASIGSLLASTSKENARTAA